MKKLVAPGRFKWVEERLTCIHLGPVPDSSCMSCKDRTELKAPCSIHTECFSQRLSTKKTKGCLDCTDYSPIQVVAVKITALGIGDQTLVLTAAEGLRLSGLEVILIAQQHVAEWALLFNGYDRIGTSDIPGITTFKPNDTYLAQNRERLVRPRYWYYANACGTIAHLPHPKTLTEVAWAERFRGCIVLTPFSLSGNREWLISHWLHLERLLNEQGRRCVILDGRSSEPRRTNVFRSPVFRDESPAKVASLLAISDCVVANDSGIAHVAGMLRTPTIALCGQFRGEGIYGIYPTVKVIQGTLSCTACHEHREVGYNDICKSLCANLQLITPQQVLAQIETIAQPPLGLCELATDRAIQASLSKLCGNVPDRRKTMLAFMKRVVGKQVAETGCQRSDDDYGAGMSTTLLGWLLTATGGKLTSIDNSQEHVAFARSRTKGLSVSVVKQDSREWLLRNTADAIYLDSQDTWEPGYQDCCLAEAVNATTETPTKLILIDDTWEAKDGWDGKGAKAVPWLLKTGWRIVEQGYQTLLER
jgi:hypothetical protein